jgi:hypothetical protein
MSTWSTRQVTLAGATVTQLVPKAMDRKFYLIIPTTAVSLFVGSTENVSATNGFLCIQSVPFPFFQGMVDPNSEVYGIITAGGTVSILECFYGPDEVPDIEESNE